MSALQLKNLDLTCGSCTGLLKEKIYEAPCSSLGKTATSAACSRLKPDVFSLFSVDPKAADNLRILRTTIAKLRNSELQAFAALLAKERKTRKHGFSFMEKVYVRVGPAGRDYLNHFAVAYVLDATREYVRLISESGKTSITLINDREGSSFYKVDAFRPIRDAIFASKKWKDPETTAKEKASQTIQTLDTAKAEGTLETKTARRRKIKVVDGRDDLISLVSKLGRRILETTTGRDTRKMKSKSGKKGKNFGVKQDEHGEIVIGKSWGQAA